MNIIEKLGITPGPWKVNDAKFAGDEVVDCSGRTSDESDIVYANCNNEQWKGNLKLIAEAPEMLEALIEATIEIMNNDINEYKWSKKDAIRRNDGYISVIEKATGKTWEEIKELLEVEDE